MGKMWKASFPRKMRDTIIVGDPLISDGRSGSHPANTVFETSMLIKRISGRTGVSLWFRRYTCGFSVAQLHNDNLFQRLSVALQRGNASPSTALSPPNKRRCGLTCLVFNILPSGI